MHYLSILIRRLASNDKGAVAIIFGLMIIPLVLAIGVGVDYSHAVQFKAQLQSATDSAALAGASAYVSSDSTGQSLGTTAATNYMNNAITALPTNNGVTVTVTPGTTSSSGTTTAFQMTVTATATISTTLMSLWKPTLSITTTATANNPIVTGTFDTGGFSSNACDNNLVYWYIVPANGGVPAASAVNLLWDNNNPNPPTNVKFSVAASQHIGFALKNVTAMGPGCNYGGWNYGNNMYGAHPGDAQWFYSHLQPPALDWNIAPGGANTGSHGNYPSNENCSLFVEKGTYSNGQWTYPSAPQGNCYSSNGQNESYNTTDWQGNQNSVTCCDTTTTTMSKSMTNAAASCSQLGGVSYQYDWNDMGWSFDSINYGNDMQYSFTCSGGSGAGNGTTTSSVTLTN